METGEAICGNSTDGSHTFCVKFLRKCNSTIVTGGAQCSVRFWDYDKPNNKLRPMEVNLGQLRRIVNCVFIDDNDAYLYCGTTTGDLLQVSLCVLRYDCFFRSVSRLDCCGARDRAKV